jgi:hypothetical protein
MRRRLRAAQELVRTVELARHNAVLLLSDKKRMYLLYHRYGMESREVFWSMHGVNVGA